MPEMPEVESLREFLAGRCLGRVVARAELAAFTALKTFDPPLSALHGLAVTGVLRRGKFLLLEVDGLVLAVHLARAGWLRWREKIPATPARPGKGPLALRLVLDDDSGFDLTEAGTQRKLAVYVVTDPEQVPGIASLGPDPTGDDFGRPELDAVLAAAGRAQLKGVLRDQRVLAGIGNAYSDEILHAARMSPFTPASNLDDTARDVLLRAIKDELAEAVERSRGLAAADLKSEKRSGMAVHGRTGQACPVCADTVAEVSFADRSLQYCPRCQTGGKKLADRRMSRLLR